MIVASPLQVVFVVTFADGHSKMLLFAVRCLLRCCVLLHLLLYLLLLLVSRVVAAVVVMCSSFDAYDYMRNKVSLSEAFLQRRKRRQKETKMRRKAYFVFPSTVIIMVGNDDTHNK